MPSGTTSDEDNNLVKHAERELRLGGWFADDSDYGGMMGDAVMDLVREFAAQGHSGYSAGLCLNLFEQVASYKPLTPIGSTDDEWMEVGEGMWQNRRSPSIFSDDRGKTWYDIDARAES